MSLDLHKYTDNDRPLTISEVDENWDLIVAAVEALQSSGTGVVGLKMVVRESDGTVKFIGTDDSVLGEFQLVSTPPFLSVGLWSSGVDFTQRNLVVVTDVTYLCSQPHTSGSDFAVDLAAGKWTALSSAGEGVSTITAGPGDREITLTGTRGTTWVVTVPGVDGESVADVEFTEDFELKFTGNKGSIWTVALPAWPAEGVSLTAIPDLTSTDLQSAIAELLGRIQALEGA